MIFQARCTVNNSLDVVAPDIPACVTILHLKLSLHHPTLQGFVYLQPDLRTGVIKHFLLVLSFLLPRV